MDRYESLRQMEGWDQTALQQMTVLVAGVGALGNEVAKNLALVGVGRIILVDFDRVAISNLSRSVLFRECDQGQPKAIVAAQALRAINPDVSVIGWQADVTREIGLGVFRRMDIIFGCVDSIAARYHLNRRCWRAGVPWVEGGIAQHIGLVKVFHQSEGACYECTMAAQDFQALSPKRRSCSDPPAQAERPSIPTSPIIASMAGALMVQQALATLRGHIKGWNGWHLNAATGESLPVQFLRRSNCFTHSEPVSETIIELPYSAAELSLGTLLGLASERLGKEPRVELGRSVVTGLACPRCSENEEVWLERDGLVEEQRQCPRCGTRRQPAYVQSLGLDTPHLDRPLETFGIPPLDILLVSSGSQYCFFELSQDVSQCLNWISSGIRT